ncbi:MAG TPA: AraC family transcriptional regulator [Sunxiuqinia sp.]|nr:AraC family transcriptional regulator [Sunxiuqinia sp.]
MDVLSDVLRVVRLTGSIFFTADLGDPFSVASPGSETILRYMPQKAECVSLFHIITKGKCWFEPADGKPFLLRKGSVIIFPHSCAHNMFSDRSIRPVPLQKLLSMENILGLSDVKYGGEGTKTQFICGYLLCDQRFNPLLGAIPEVIVLTPVDEVGNKHPQDGSLEEPRLPLVPDGWLDMTLRQLADEVRKKNVGSSTIVTRLTELMYIEVLRRYMQSLPEKSNGWLAALRDHEIGKALRLLHAHPGRKWNVEVLATEVGVSRSAFAQRFSNLIGESPMRYLTSWRMQVAKNLLLQPDLNLAMIAEKIGYDSDIAFNRAFKRYVGEPPAHWRNQMLSQA